MITNKSNDALSNRKGKAISAHDGECEFQGNFIKLAQMNLLTTTFGDEAKDQVRLVKGVKKEMKMLQGNSEAIQAVVDAHQRQVKEGGARLCPISLRGILRHGGCVG